jgi:hypothetical protein
MELLKLLEDKLELANYPEPVVLSNDSELYLAFFAFRLVDDEHDKTSEAEIIVIKIKHPLKHTFGAPSNETIQKHPCYKLGLKPCGFYEVKNSYMLRELEEIQKSHHHFHPDIFKKYRHFILTFHDNTFECVAEDFQLLDKTETQFQLIAAIADNAARTGKLL